ncbi:MAG: hypothetical protein HGA19_21425, partial [Oscillochloris sp.]|nr:hypothetical protein [Oscillochloris sp.]
HIHGIVLLDAGAAGDAVEADPGVRPQRIPTLSTVVQWFKTMTTNAYIQGVRDQAWSPFDRRLWQRNFYEHIVRGEDDMERVRAYIADNPAQWRLDFSHYHEEHEPDMRAWLARQEQDTPRLG